jgi:hypothetical protein
MRARKKYVGERGGVVSLCKLCQPLGRRSIYAVAVDKVVGSHTQKEAVKGGEMFYPRAHAPCTRLSQNGCIGLPCESLVGQ